MQHISVCICTFKRPELLKRLLSELDRQRTGGLFNFSVVVVDNDINESARPTVNSFMEASKRDLTYHVEPEQNIALARNRAVENARGDFIAFIDDDEYPADGWLLNLYTTLGRYGADGVLGPVKPFYENNCPKWIIKGKLCERKSHPTGKIMYATESRTGNLLFKREIIDDTDNRFDPAFGRTGGEDVFFFKKVMEKGCVFVWCDEAVAYETISPERYRASYYLKRSIRMGGLTGDEQRTKGLPGRSYPRVLAAFIAYTVILPFTAFLGKHTLMKYLVKSVYNFAWLSGYCGYVIIRLRDD